MKRHAISLTSLFLLLMTAQTAVAQQPYRDGPIWRMVFMRSKPGQLENYLKNFKGRTLPAMVEEKEKGIILDYKIMLNTKKADPQDWDIIIAYQFKDQAAYYAFVPMNDEIETRVVGGPEGRNLTAVQREPMKETLKSVFVKEITLK
jgi:hypothetical protein